MLFDVEMLLMGVLKNVFSILLSRELWNLHIQQQLHQALYCCRFSGYAYRIGVNAVKLHQDDAATGALTVCVPHHHRVDVELMATHS